MKALTEKEIKNYIENDKNGKMITIDFEKKEFQYQPNGKSYEIKGFFENVEKWMETLTIISGEKYSIASWWRGENNIDWNLLQEGETLVIMRETEKAVLFNNNAGTEVWIPKSVIKKIGR
jgi:hypothetical protein